PRLASGSGHGSGQLRKGCLVHAVRMDRELHDRESSKPLQDQKPLREPELPDAGDLQLDHVRHTSLSCLLGEWPEVAPRLFFSLEDFMAITFSKIVGPFGNSLFFDDGLAKVKYRVVGDGVGGAAALPFDRLTSIVTVHCDQQYNPTIDNVARTVTITVPAQIATTPVVPSPLPNNAFTVVELLGKGF